MTVQLDCEAEVQPEMFGKWLKDDVEVESVNGSIVIDRVGQGDIGWYQCFLDYLGQEYSSIAYFLSVKPNLNEDYTK